MSLRHAILGFLSIAPMSGYDVKKVIDQSVGHFWTADQSQIYRTLTGLVDEELASRETVMQEGRPNQHVHSVTDLGLAELDRWLASPLQPQPSREPFLARLFFANRMPPDRIRELLKARKQEVGEQLAALKMLVVPDHAPEHITETEFVLRMATLSYGITRARAEFDWLETTEHQLEGISS